ncbi:hypothetical protein WJX72_008616 [[Myrmecia] bisecta]|uniref:LsmAD domain-containing protein n=1 Tax=[Myrmecia] bisecta TaxID=41462 RepID=A0AAW1PQL0_9CHLO
MSVLIGYTVEVQVKSGAVYEGIFHALHPENKDLNVVLKEAKLIRDSAKGDGSAIGQRHKVLIVYSADLVQLVAKDIRMSAEDVGPVGGADDEREFSTDAAISRGRGGSFGRELQRWTPAEGEALELERLEDSSRGRGRGSGNWDQFAANKEMYGVQTTFDEDVYTTKLDKSATRISEREAARIAAEIESSVAGHYHLAEERGDQIDDSGIDEEERWSSVHRAPSSTSGAQAQAQAQGEAQAQEDARNADTFGSSASSQAGESLQAESSSTSAEAGVSANGAGPKGAWTNAGASVAAVSGGQRWDRPSTVKTSAPVDVRREHNKLREHLTGTKKDRSSPYGTPKGLKSPLASPLVGNPAKLEALDLNPGTARYDDQTRKAFSEFKASQVRSKAEAAKQARSSELRNFSQELKFGGARSDDLAPSTSSAASDKASSSPASTPPGPAPLPDTAASRPVASLPKAMPAKPLPASAQAVASSSSRPPSSAGTAPSSSSGANGPSREQRRPPSPGMAGPGPRRPEREHSRERSSSASANSSGYAHSNHNREREHSRERGGPAAGAHHPKQMTHSVAMAGPGPGGPMHMGMPMAMQPHMGAWMPQQFMPGQPFMAPMAPGMPQQQIMPYAMAGPRPYGPGGGPPYMMPAGPYGMMYAGPPGMAAGPGRPQMFPPQGYAMQMGSMPPHGMPMNDGAAGGSSPGHK